MGELIDFLNGRVSHTRYESRIDILTCIIGIKLRRESGCLVIRGFVMIPNNALVS